MAGKFEITKKGDGTFTFEFLIDEKAVRKLYTRLSRRL